MKKDRHAPGSVDVQVKGRGMAVDPEIRDQVVRKMQKMDKYLDRLNEIHVELCAEKTREAGPINLVEATTYVMGRTIRVVTSNGDLLAAVDEAVDKLYRQLNRQKERAKGHHAIKPAQILSGTENSETAEAIPLDDEDENGTAGSIVQVDRLAMKPQFEDEAIEELEAQDRDFYVFLNARNEQVNVLYRRPDGQYALIEPTAG